MSIEAQLAAFSLNAAPPVHARDVLRLALFDWSVCGIAGRGEPVAQILRNSVDCKVRAGASAVIGGGYTAAAQAALINGATSHALDYDDTHFAHIGHTSVVVFPAALAVAGDQDFATFLRCAVIGTEVAIRIGIWLGRGHYQIGFHQTATAGAFGAAVAAGLQLGLTKAELITALGLAATKAAGLKGQFGTMGKPLNAGLAAETGVLAAQWAKAGMTSSAEGLSGAGGFGRTHAGTGDLDALAGLSEAWQAEKISHKFHACCHGLHAMLEALRGVEGPFAHVQVWTHPRWLSVCNILAPKTGLECKFSYRMTAAMALSGMDTASVDAFTDNLAHDPAIAAMRERVFVTGDTDLTEMQARVVLQRPNGVAKERFFDLDRPIPATERKTRLMQKARAVIGRASADDLWDAIAAGDLMRITGRLQAP